MILFGYRSFVKFLAMLTLICPRCHNPAAHRLQQRSRWFTLFFIPLIPMGFTRFTTCTFCGLSQKVSKQDADGMIAAANGQPDPSATQQGYPPQGYPQQSHPPQAQGPQGQGQGPGPGQGPDNGGY